MYSPFPSGRDVDCGVLGSLLYGKSLVGQENYFVPVVGGERVRVLVWPEWSLKVLLMWMFLELAERLYSPGAT